MRTCNALLVALCAGMALTKMAVAANQPASPPAPGFYPMVSRPLVIGPKDSDLPRGVSGKIRILCRVAENKAPAEVEVFVDDKSIGKLSKPPFVWDYDTSALSDGDHTFKAVAKDTGASAFWTASSKVTVGQAGPAGSAAAPTPSAPTAPGPAVGPNGENPPHGIGPGTPPSATAAPVPEKTYSSVKHGFSVKFPRGWTAMDETASMKPKFPGGVWIVLKDPAGLVVNIRRQKLEPGTDADTFAKYNDYVLKWERKEVLGSPAFATTTSDPAHSRVVHRLIVVKDGMAWMFNCIDKTGKDTERSQGIFDAIVNTLGPAQGSSAGVTIREVKPRK